jgi:dolichol-phosphate mannosyltransferase
MMEQSAELTIIAPCYNEAAVVDQFLAELTRELDGVDVVWRVCFIDDGSTDATLERLNMLAKSDRRVRVYSLSRNFGHQIALSAGLDVSLGSAVVLMDADLQHPPSVIPRMVELWRGGSDHAAASREETEGANCFKRDKKCLPTDQRLRGDDDRSRGVDFVSVGARACGALRDAGTAPVPARHGIVDRFHRTYVSFQAPRRLAGESKYTTLKMLAPALTPSSRSAAPMRMATRLEWRCSSRLFYFSISGSLHRPDDFVRDGIADRDLMMTVASS